MEEQENKGGGVMGFIQVILAIIVLCFSIPLIFI